MIDMKLLFAAIAIALLTMLLSNFVMMLYVIFFKLAEIESHLKNCHLVQSNRPKREDGFWGRRYRLTLITAILRKQPSRLLLDDPRAIEDVRKLPAHLRRWIEIPYRMNACSLIGILALYGWAEFAGLI
jgi:hypothetical protein